MQIKTLKLTFRAFEKVAINDLLDFNVFIGPNNAGKSSIFEAIRILAESLVAAELHGQRWDYFMGVRVNLGDAAELAVEFTVDSDCLVGLLVTANQVTPYVPAGEEALMFGDRAVQSQLMHVSRLATDDERVHRIWQQSTPAGQLIQNAYFLGHSRGAPEPSPLIATPRLDRYAENLAARVDELLGNSPQYFGSALTDFVNEVVPGVGTIGSPDMLVGPEWIDVGGMELDPAAA